MDDDKRLICYAKEPHDRPEGNGWTPLSGWTFTDWQGNVIGKGRCDSHWRTGPYGTKMYQFTIRLADGRVYKGRGQGSMMSVRARRSKAA